MNILMLSPQYRPIVGGYERAAERLCQALARQGQAVTVITERRDRTWPARESVDGYTLRRLGCIYRRHWHSLTSLLSFTGFLLLQGRRFDVWHVHQYGLHAGLAIALGKLLRRPVALKLTSSASQGIGKTLEAGIGGRWLAAWHRRVAVCLAVSEETRAEARQFGIPAERIILLPNGLDETLYQPASPDERTAARQALGLTDHCLVLCVGRLSPVKNPLGLLDAWAQLNESVRQGARLVFVGDGPERPAMEAWLAASGVADSVHLAGMQAEVSTWYRAADMLVIPSHTEGLCNAMIEALAFGLPVISTAVSGSSVLTSGPPAGLRVPVGDSPALTAVLTELMTDALLRQKLGRQARLIFEDNFSMSRMLSQLLHVYRDLVTKNTATIFRLSL